MFGKSKAQRNPEGQTKEEFLEQYKGIPTIAKLCWWLGIKPEVLKEELKKLMNESDK